MKPEELYQFFEKHNDEFLKFDRVKNPLSYRPDMHAFRLLDSLAPGTKDLIGSAAHDEFYLDIDLDELLKNASEDELIDLHRCGVRYSSEYDCLCMFA